jgi:acetolactate synthase-1/2/3 large subunit
MPKKTAGRILYETLKAQGVACLFGMEDPIHVFHAVDRAATRIVTVRDEKHGAIMAHAYAQVTGRPGVCAATFGPGASNLVTGLLEAKQSSVPVIALVQDHPLQLKDKHAGSALDHKPALEPFVKAVIRIDFPEQVAELTRRAFRLAVTGRPGPVALICPTDVMAAPCEIEPEGDPAYSSFPANRVRASVESIEQASRILASAGRPVIVAGGGSVISGAFEEVVQLAERFAAPVVTTMTGKGAIAESHPLSGGVLGSSTGGKLGRGQIANQLLAEADVVFILGSRTGQICYINWTLPKAGVTVMHLDIDPEEIGRNFKTDVPMVGDVRDSLRDLLRYAAAQGLKSEGRPDNGARIAMMMEDWRRDLHPAAHSDQTPIRPERVFEEINRCLNRSSLLVTDASYVTGWAMSQLDVPASGRFILSPRGTAGIGWSLPAGIGAKLGDPGRNVICVTGDGGFGYVMNELETAARYAVNLLVVVFNNSTLAFQRHWEELAMGTYQDCAFLDVDYSEVARALKCGGESVTDPSALSDAIARGLAYEGPYLLNVVVDPDAAAPIVGFDKPIPSGASH